MALLELCYTPIRRQGVPDALCTAAAPLERREAFRWYEHAILHDWEGRWHGVLGAGVRSSGGPASDAAVL